MKSLATLALALMLSLAACASSRHKVIPTPHANLIERVKLSLVQVNYPVDAENHAVCAGFSVNAPKGWILTAAHCIKEEGKQVKDITVNGKPATVVNVDEQFAMLKVEAQKYPPLAIYEGTSKVGDRVFNFGYGMGVLSVLPRYIAIVNEGDIALDGPTIKGMSGGPVVDMAGRVVGLNQANAVVGIACGAGEIRAFIRATASGSSGRH